MTFCVRCSQTAYGHDICRQFILNKKWKWEKENYSLLKISFPHAFSKNGMFYKETVLYNVTYHDTRILRTWKWRPHIQNQTVFSYCDHGKVWLDTCGYIFSTI